MFFNRVVNADGTWSISRIDICCFLSSNTLTLKINLAESMCTPEQMYGELDAHDQTSGTQGNLLAALQ